VTLKVLSENIELAVAGKLVNDYKTKLQEQIQQHGESVIEYVLESATGPEHDKTFLVSLYINHQRKTKGSGKTKKEAEQNAAKAYLINKA
jgi:ribonuclease-3